MHWNSNNWFAGVCCRMSCSGFMDISRDINIKVTDIEKEREKISMFA